MAKKFNILIILTDQQSSGMMSCAGNNYLKTPAMDYLAGRGISFYHAYCTNPVCVPSRFSLLTGHMPGEIGLVNNFVKDSQTQWQIVKNKALGHILRSAGYETFYGGKLHLPGLIPEDAGFINICNDERYSF
ncbi:MAG: sulfatase-like hydrolase/transferase [bacterium]|nr:sulfatase-like hydrolase/transferase [bacterium]